MNQLVSLLFVLTVNFCHGQGEINAQIRQQEKAIFNTPDSTLLPLILINTNGQNILDEPKITANMKVIDNGLGEYNRLTDIPNGYHGDIGIEIRGRSSANYPQKPYGIETREPDGSNKNVSLLGMPEENDWILLSHYNDKVLFRNALSFNIFRSMGNYAPRIRLCEVIIDDDYRGIYAFTEKIKRDDNRINISTLNSDENSGDDLTGGYIFRIDYWTASTSWIANFKNPNFPRSSVRFVYNYPDENDITQEQKAYLQTTVSVFEDALWGVDFLDPEEGYRTHIDVPSFIDYFIVAEFSRNVDGYKKSRNFYKNKDSQDPRIYAGPVWDFDWAYKDHEYTRGRGWRFNYSGQSDIKPPGWYIRMMQDPQFREELNDRYRELRSTVLDTTRIFHSIDSMAALVDRAQQRHYTRWPTLGFDTGTPEIGDQPDTYEEVVVQFKGWITERLSWLDENMPPEPSPFTIVLEADLETNPSPLIYPNPTDNELHIELNSESQIEEIILYNMTGSVIKSHKGTSKKALLDVSGLKGTYLLIILTSKGAVINRRLVVR